ncbi:MAG TPA: tRNA (adenosine(37)-N6)-dimethylallyltransferase MiaA [Ignavibacteriales bacterium]|nr:tRNA (adenosine(37)-N6)-dimethylallyltransferase MiaA [Ignavibacteriales bacterium]
MNKLVAILGPTAVGKTRLAARLAYEFNGEILSADSRQVFRGMDIGTGKDLQDYTVNGSEIAKYLIDLKNPDEEFNLFLFVKEFYKNFDNITSRGKLPFLAGGTGLYLSSILQGYKLKEAEFRDDLYADMTLEEILGKLQAYKNKLHNITDIQDKERALRALQIFEAERELNMPGEKLEPLVIGVHLERNEIKKRITERLKARLNSGMIDEVKALLDKGVTYERLMFFGLEYKYISLYLQGSLNYNDMFQKLNSSIHAFAKRQMTWFRKMEKEGVKINWIERDDIQKAGQLIGQYIKNN